MSELTKEDEYGIISRTMMNIRSLRVFAREIDFEQLLEMQEKLNVVIGVSLDIENYCTLRLFFDL
ncbi:hypothetical protein FSF19_020925, partial [Escherichia coli]|nr:hypothetical protein [Escherichia coli]